MVALRGDTHKEATIAICPCKPSFSPKAFVSKAPPSSQGLVGHRADLTHRDLPIPGVGTQSLIKTN